MLVGLAARAVYRTRRSRDGRGAGSTGLRGDPVRVIQAVALGVGFLGGGAISAQRSPGHVVGLTTAASIWATAADRYRRGLRSLHAGRRGHAAPVRRPARARAVRSMDARSVRHRRHVPPSGPSRIFCSPLPLHRCPAYVPPVGRPSCLSGFRPRPALPHGYCLLWQPGLIWLHAGSDASDRRRVRTIRYARQFPALSDETFRSTGWSGARHLHPRVRGDPWLGVLNIWVPTWAVHRRREGADGARSVPTAIRAWPLFSNGSHS